MNTQTIIPVGNDVQGDITSCKIDNAVLSISKNSALSLTERTTYASYNVCTKEVIQTYEVPNVTTFALVSPLVIGYLVFIAFVCYAFYNMD